MTTDRDLALVKAGMYVMAKYAFPTYSEAGIKEVVANIDPAAIAATVEESPAEEAAKEEPSDAN